MKIYLVIVFGELLERLQSMYFLSFCFTPLSTLSAHFVIHLKEKNSKHISLACKWMDIADVLVLFDSVLFLLKTSGNASKESGNWAFAWKGGFLKLGSNFARLPSSNVP